MPVGKRYLCDNTHHNIRGSYQDLSKHPQGLYQSVEQLHHTTFQVVWFTRLLYNLKLYSIVGVVCNQQPFWHNSMHSNGHKRSTVAYKVSNEGYWREAALPSPPLSSPLLLESYKTDFEMLILAFTSDYQWTYISATPTTTVSIKENTSHQCQQCVGHTYHTVRCTLCSDTPLGILYSRKF